MSRAVKQPIGQKRLTNIAVVRIRKHGKKFEVACYKNKVANWRAGIETDLDEVLQTTTVFAHVGRGVLAAAEDVAAAFGTTDPETVCRAILADGAVQVSDREREVGAAALFKDVAAAVAARCVHPGTGRPYTATMVERALRGAGVALDARRPAKAQALEAIALLKGAGLPIERARMRLRVTVPADGVREVGAALAGLGVVVESTDLALDGGEAALTCLADPGAFRAVHAAVGRGGAAEGARVEVLSVAAVDAGAAAVAGGSSGRVGGAMGAGGGGPGAAHPHHPPPPGTGGDDDDEAAAEAALRSAGLLGRKGAGGGADDALATGLRSLRVGGDTDGEEGAGAVAARDPPPGAAPQPRPPPPAGPTTAYARGPIAGLPATFGGARRALFDELDALQPGAWTVELVSRGGGPGGGGPGGGSEVLEAVFYGPGDERVGSFAAARRAALKASKGRGGG